MSETENRGTGGVSRRGMLALGGAAAAAAGLSLGRVDPAEAATPHAAATSGPTQTTADVVVVGAGVSGLTAARRLVQAGVGSVLVLEANNRVGGRTVNLNVAPGVITEGGGQWVGPGQDRVLSLIDELGLSTFKTYVDGNSIYLRNGNRQTYTGTIPPIGPAALADFAQVQTRLEQMASTIPPDAPWAAPNANEWDGTTFGAWLDQNSLVDESRWLWTLAFTVIVAEDPHNTSLLRILHAIKTSGGVDHMINTTGGAQESRVVGGTQQISLTMANQLGQRVILGSPVSEIIQGSQGVLVKSARAQVQCKQVIVAMSPNDAERIAFTPVLPVRREVLQRKWHNGTANKLFAVYDKPFWRAAGFSGQAITDLPTTPYVSDNSPPDGSVGILLTFMGTAGSGPGLKWRDSILNDPAARRAAFLQDLTTLFGPQAAQPTQFLEQDWVHEPWIQGCISSAPPGLITEYTTAVSDPVGRIHWAGTETSTGANEGYIDGAVRAGERAAKEARDAL